MYIHFPSTDLLENSLTHTILPHLAPTTSRIYENNELINQCLELVPDLLLSKRSINILKECDREQDTEHDIQQHISEIIQQIQITVDDKKEKYYSVDGTSIKLSDGTYLLQINQELFDDCINTVEQASLNKAKLRLIVSICHEFVHHKMHKFLLNDKWGKSKEEITPPEISESGFYWEDHVVGGRIVKIDKIIYSFKPKLQAKFLLDDELSMYLLDKANYNDE